MQNKGNFPHLKAISEESRAKGHAVRQEKKEESLNWKQSWADEPLWAHLRKKAGLRAIPSYIHCSETKYIKRTLKAVHKDIEWWKEYFFPSYKDFGENNPNVPAFVLQGIMLEAAMPEEVALFRVGD
jgi:hypothetical protein